MSEKSDMTNNSGPGSHAEPSMEEILASIRRILKEDEGQEESGPQDDDDVLLLDESMVVTPADISSATMLPVDTGLIEAHPDAPYTQYHEPLHFSSEPEVAAPVFAPEPEPEVPAFEAPPASDYVTATAAEELEAPMEDHLQSPDGLVGAQASEAIHNTLGSLVRSISQERSLAVSRGGITIEDIVREEIKPVLKAWLDSHLPSLVERIVRAEIERVVDRTQL
jgi:cell pole-organizing protein PopZ